jgi:hypothetical protein
MAYIYNIALNFPTGLELGQLQTAILNEPAITTALQGLVSDTIDLTITFIGALSVPELTALNNLIITYIFISQPMLDPTGASFNFCMTNLIYRADNTSFQTISQLAWVDSLYRRFVIPTFAVNFTVYDRNLEWILYDITNATTLGTAIVASSGTYTYSIVNPISDTVIELRIRKTAGGGQSPEINSSILEYTA